MSKACSGGDFVRIKRENRLSDSCAEKKACCESLLKTMIFDVVLEIERAINILSSGTKLMSFISVSNNTFR